MEREEILQGIVEEKIVSILRFHDGSKIIPTAQAILKGGIRVIEVSLNTPNALDGISELSNIPGVIAGVGTVTNKRQAIDAIKAGAQFVVSPISKKELINTCHSLGKPIFPGAFTPSEIYQAHEWGADVVKVFPAEVLGMNYIKAVLEPFPDIKLMPTGGVTPDNIDKWFDVGAICVGIGGSFTKADIIEHEEWGRLTGIAKSFSNNIAHYTTNRNK